MIIVYSITKQALFLFTVIGVESCAIAGYGPLINSAPNSYNICASGASDIHVFKDDH